MKRTPGTLLLTALACLLFVGCIDDGTRLSLYDGYSMTGAARRDIDGTTFRVTTPRNGGWQVVEFTVPDDRVAALPLALPDVESTCRFYSAGVTAPEAADGHLRIVEAHHDGLLAEYSFTCNGRSVTGVGLFEVAGSGRDGVWAYAPEPLPSALAKLLDTAEYATAGIF